MLPPPLAPLAAWPQFVTWRLEPGDRPEKPDKILYSPIHGRRASHSNPADWGTLEQAEAFAAASGMRVGFVFSENDPFFFLDIDGALVDGQWSPLAQELCASLPGCAVEISQSGKGLHIFGTLTRPLEHSSKNTQLHIELYHTTRFAALTGDGAIGSISTVADDALAAVVGRYFNPAARTAALSADWTTEPDPEWAGPEDDAELIERAVRSGANSAAAAFGGAPDKVNFAALWCADASVLSTRWPSNAPGGDFDHSSADQSLANALAFWTGRNCERMERLMRQSALMRGKWDDRPDYLETTILKAISLVRTVLKAGGQTNSPPPTPPTAAQIEQSGFAPRNGSAYMSHGDQMVYFAGCVYVSGPHKILTPRGELLDQGRFDAVYGGNEFVLSLDGKKTTTSAWEAFTRAQTFTPDRADKLCFRPELGAGGIVDEAGKRLANAYLPAKVELTNGDPAKFLNHMRKMLPAGEDLEILLSYMASVVQNPGMKAQWWPVVQGAEGNFKSFLLMIMSHAVGAHYAHVPNMSKMVKGDSNFNGWIERKLFLGLDEVYAADRREFFEGFKTTVTNRSIPIEGKGIEEVTGDNRANGLIVTNHKNGVPITGTSRRYAVFFCAQQTPADMLRDGMTPEYIADLKDWLLGLGSYADLGLNYGVRVMGTYLRTRPIEARLDPARLSIRCPETTSTAAAIIAGLGRIEQEIMEAVGEERPGFCGGWISSFKLDELLERRRLSVPRNKRRELLQALGYDWHPALEATQGRVNTIVRPDDSKPRLFCKVGSISWLNLTEPAQVANAYSDAQAITAGALTASQFKK